MQERKKNRFDPVANPSMFFRRENQQYNKKAIAIDKIARKVWGDEEKRKH